MTPLLDEIKVIPIEPVQSLLYKSSIRHPVLVDLLNLDFFPLSLIELILLYLNLHHQRYSFPLASNSFNSLSLLVNNVHSATNSVHLLSYDSYNNRATLRDVLHNGQELFTYNHVLEYKHRQSDYCLRKQDVESISMNVLVNEEMNKLLYGRGKGVYIVEYNVDNTRVNTMTTTTISNQKIFSRIKKRMPLKMIAKNIEHVIVGSNAGSLQSRFIVVSSEHGFGRGIKAKLKRTLVIKALLLLLAFPFILLYFVNDKLNNNEYSVYQKGWILSLLMIGSFGLSFVLGCWLGSCSEKYLEQDFVHVNTIEHDSNYSNLNTHCLETFEGCSVKGVLVNDLILLTRGDAHSANRVIKVKIGNSLQSIEKQIVDAKMEIEVMGADFSGYSLFYVTMTGLYMLTFIKPRSWQWMLEFIKRTCADGIKAPIRQELISELEYFVDNDSKKVLSQTKSPNRHFVLRRWLGNGWMLQIEPNTVTVEFDSGINSE